MKKLTIILLLLTAGLYSQSHNLQQVVVEWPADCDTNGIHWTVYNIAEPETKVLRYDTIGSSTNFQPTSHLIVWNANTGNFPGNPAWLPGDSIIAFGSWDSAYANDPVAYMHNPNHTGFYWLFSDTLTTEEPQQWSPEDTLRIMPKPIVEIPSATNGVDSIVIKIPNPQETRRADQSAYDILGYQLYMAEHRGTPANFTHHVAYVPVQGTQGDTTIFMDIESNYTCVNIFYAYKMVTRPDTTIMDTINRGHTSAYLSINSDMLTLNWPGTAPGYMTPYLSQNSESVSITYIGVNEIDPTVPPVCYMTVTPNPFQTSTTITLKSHYALSITTAINIYDAAGRLIRILSRSPEESIFTWDGADDNGNDTSPGVYFCRAHQHGSSKPSTTKVIKID